MFLNLAFGILFPLFILLLIPCIYFHQSPPPSPLLLLSRVWFLLFFPKLLSGTNTKILNYPRAWSSLGLLLCLFVAFHFEKIIHPRKRIVWQPPLFRHSLKICMYWSTAGDAMPTNGKSSFPPRRPMEGRRFQAELVSVHHHCSQQRRRATFDQ